MQRLGRRAVRAVAATLVIMLVVVAWASSSSAAGPDEAAQEIVLNHEAVWEACRGTFLSGALWDTYYSNMPEGSATLDVEGPARYELDQAPPEDRAAAEEQYLAEMKPHYFSILDDIVPDYAISVEIAGDPAATPPVPPNCDRLLSLAATYRVAETELPDCQVQGTAPAEGWSHPFLVVNPALWELTQDRLMAPGFLNQQVEAAAALGREGEWYVDAVMGAGDETTQETACYLIARTLRPRCTSTTSSMAATSDDSRFVPDRCWGLYSGTLYDIGYDGGTLTDVEKRFKGVTTGLFFNLGKLAIQMAMWLVGWAFSFNLTDYTDLSSQISQTYQSKIVLPLGLEDVAWFVLFAVVALAAVRGKLARAGGEIALSLALVTLSGVLVQNQDDYMCSVSARMDEASTALLSVAIAGDIPGPIACTPSGRYATGGGPAVGSVGGTAPGGATDPKALEELQRTLFHQFVELPYDYVNWGRAIADDDPCRPARDQIVSVGPHGSHEWPRSHMAQVSGCEGLVAFNREPNWDRWGGALLNMAVSWGVLFMLALVALAILVSKLAVAVLFAVLPLAMLGAILPGTGRRLAWTWVASVLQCLLVVLAGAGVLSLMMLALGKALAAVPEGTSLTERWSVLLLFLVVFWIARRKVLGSTQRLVSRAADHMTRLSPSSRDWEVGRVRSGFDFGAIDRGAAKAARITAFRGGLVGAAVGWGAVRSAGWLVRKPVSVGWGMGVARYGRKDTARRSLQNLQAIQRYQEKRDGLQSLPFGGKHPVPPWSNAGRPLRAEWPHRAHLGHVRQTSPAPEGGGRGAAGPGGKAGTPVVPHGTPSAKGTPRAPDGRGPELIVAGGSVRRSTWRPGGAFEGKNPGRPLSPAEQAARASAAGRGTEASLWQRIDAAQRTYRRRVAENQSPEQRVAARRSYQSEVAGHRRRYAETTGEEAPRARPPWAAERTRRRD